MKFAVLTCVLCFALQAEEGSVMVSYSVPAFLQKPNATVSIVACFSTFSQYDRAWRKGNPLNLAVSHPFLLLLPDETDQLPNK